MSATKKATTKKAPAKVAEKEKLVFKSDQTFESKDGKIIKLSTFLKEGDWWEQKGRGKKSQVLTHDAVKKIANEAGLKQIAYTVLTQPEATNNYQYLLQVVLVNANNEPFIDLGETNRSNLGNRGRNYPAMMAQKRAFDRAVFSATGITGLLSEEELTQEEEEKMETLTMDEQKGIAKMVNQITLAKTKENLYQFNRDMKAMAQNGTLGDYSDKQLDYLRSLYQKKIGQLQKTAF